MNHETLFSWAQAYIKYKDSVHRRVFEMKLEESSKKIHIKNKNGSEEIYVCINHLEGPSDNIKDKKVVCLNTKDNLNWLIKNWDSLKQSRNIFIFVNPAVSESWSVHPSIHDVVTDKVALNPGLLSLFGSIPEYKG